MFKPGSVRVAVTHPSRFLSTLLMLVVLVQELGLGLLGSFHLAQAEGFSQTPFQEQWSLTDAEVANGKVARTYFWGPQAFAHTQEVYSESPTNTREVQYFDKGRMELSRKPGQNPTAVTNGLLTVELVSGRLQVGDATFINHNPATNPVAGDPTNNEACPTYATFNAAKLAFGVGGAVGSTNRSGQTVDEGLKKDGTILNIGKGVGNPNPLPNITYSNFVSDTKHNIASVFYDFFLTAPLGSDKWLAVMGLPISEPYWVIAKVAGREQAVLVQLFERRALTYTPANPSGFQVEMANIGQHYYAWRYDVALQASTLPGNYRLLWTQGTSLYSSSIHKAENFKLAETGGVNEIRDVVPNKNGVAAINTSNTVNLVDLVKPGQVKPLPRDAVLNTYDGVEINGLVWSQDGQHLAVAYTTYNAHPRPIGYSNNITVIQMYDLDGLNLLKTTTVYNKLTDIGDAKLKMSSDGRYLTLFGNRDADYKQVAKIKTLNLEKHNEQIISLDQETADIELSNLEWVSNSNQLLVSYNHTVKGYGRLALIEPDSVTPKLVVDVPFLKQASLSPDGNFVALLSEGFPNLITVTFRALANLPVELASSGVITIDQNYPPVKYDFFNNTLLDWSVDSSYISFRSVRFNSTERQSWEFRWFNPLNGKTILQNEVNWQGNIYGIFYRSEPTTIGGPHYLIHDVRWFPYNYIFSQDVTVQNSDGSDNINLYSTKDGDKFVKVWMIVQVPLTRK